MTTTEWQPTACILCEANCGIEVQLDGRTLARIRGDKAHPASQGYTCNKAMRLDHYQNGLHRLTTPLRRRADGRFESVDWETAVDEVAAGFARIRDAHGGASIFYYGGGGQGNHLGGLYGGAFFKALGGRYHSAALAQEKTGEAWVDAQLYGGHTRGDFEHTEVAVFVGKNPWMSQSFPRARLVLREIAKDPERSMIVIDPVATDTAKLADFHLRVRPGSDAWVLAALAGTLVQEDLIDHEFLARHVEGAEPVVAALRDVPITDYARRCGVEESLVRAAARRMGRAQSVAVFEDLGVQQAPHSVLSSYLNKLLWILRGSFGKPGGQHLHSSMLSILSHQRTRRTPVTGAPVIAGLVPCNVIADEILTDHPDRFRAMIVESSNPAHSLADSPRMHEALEALELLVVVDVALTETAQLADYVLPVASQYEKAEATFFNLEFPRNTFHLRHRLLDPLPGTLPEPEVWTRLIRALGETDEEALASLREVAHGDRRAFTQALGQATASSPGLAGILPYVLYETLGSTLPEPLRGAAVLWGVAHRAAMTHPDAVRRAGYSDGEELFQAILEGRSGITFSLDDYEDAFSYIANPGHRIALEIPDLLAELRSLRGEHPGLTCDEFPLVLSVGERRAYTANDIFRDPGWRKRDADGALRVSIEDAQRIGLRDGAKARITTARGSAVATVEVSDAMQPGHASLPNGFGLRFTDARGQTQVAGVAPNSLTSAAWRDPLAGTPWHKHVPARIEPAAA